MPTLIKVKSNGGGFRYSGDATENQVLEGAKFYSNNKELKTGTMPSVSYDAKGSSGGFQRNTANVVYGTYSTDNSTTPYLYFEADNKHYLNNVQYYRSPASVVASALGVTSDKIASGNTICGVSGNNNVVNTSDADATAAQILSDKTAYVKGSKVTGTMTDNGAVSQTLAANGTYTIPAGYHNGSGKVTQSIPVLPSHAYIKGNTSGMTHSNATSLVYGAYSTKSLTDTSADSTNYLYYQTDVYSYTDTVGYVRASANAVASTLGITSDKIISGNTICGVAGTATSGTKVYVDGALSTSTQINITKGDSV